MTALLSCAAATLMFAAIMYYGSAALVQGVCARRGLALCHPTKQARFVAAIVAALAAVPAALIFSMPPAATAAWVMMILVATVIVLTDVAAHIIPNGYNLCLWFASALFLQSMFGTAALISGVVCAIVCVLAIIPFSYSSAKKPAIVGGGDVKLFPLMGFVCGVSGLPAALIGVLIATIASVAYYMYAHKATLRTSLHARMALAPHIMCGTAVGVLYNLMCSIGF